MPRRATPEVSSRKSPKQARSANLVDAVLEAAVQVLRDEGAGRFTTARVAERAGVSVGSLYQYFPNKAAILFRLQSDEWRSTTAMLREILEDRSHSPEARLRALVHAFIRSECEEASVRRALADAAPLYRDAPEADAARAAGSDLFAIFLVEILPDADPARRAIATEIVEMTLGQVGAAISERDPDEAALQAYADEMSAMLCAYLAQLREP